MRLAFRVRVRSWTRCPEEGANVLHFSKSGAYSLFGGEGTDDPSASAVAAAGFSIWFDERRQSPPFVSGDRDCTWRPADRPASGPRPSATETTSGVTRVLGVRRSNNKLPPAPHLLFFLGGAHEAQK